MTEQNPIEKKFFSALSSQSLKENLSFIILLMLMSLVRTRLKGKWQQKFLSSHLKETPKQYIEFEVYSRTFYICLIS